LLYYGVHHGLARRVKKFRFWAFFGLLINVILLLRGLVYLFVDDTNLLVWIILAISSTTIAATGIFATFKILQRKRVCFEIARKQVWLYFLIEIVPTSWEFLVSQSKPGIAFLTIVIVGVFAYQLSRLFNSEEAQQYCLD
jgi:hypothetical protein